MTDTADLAAGITPGLSTAHDAIMVFRKESLREVFPSEYLGRTVDEALREGGSTVRKLLIDNRFMR